MSLKSSSVKVYAILFIIAFLVFVFTACCPEKGDKGDTGAQGMQGVPGVAPTARATAAMPQQCLNGGTVLTIGTSTAIVCNGQTGAQGVRGAAGAAGTVITPVSFCGGPSVYPSTFPEYGLLINGQMYGVYSANDGFLALLPPGTYSSNAIGSSCSFVINPNGTVSRL